MSEAVEGDSRGPEDESFDEFLQRVEPNLRELAEMDIPFSDTAEDMLAMVDGGEE